MIKSISKTAKDALLELIAMSAIHDGDYVRKTLLIILFHSMKNDIDRKHNNKYIFIYANILNKNV